MRSRIEVAGRAVTAHAMVLCLLVLTVAFLAVPRRASAAEREVFEAILVRVNDRIVTISDFRDRLKTELSQIPSPPEGEARIAFANRLFDAVVDELVLLERAEEKRLSVDDAMVDRAIQNLREENNLQADEDFETAIAQAGLTVESLRDRYRQTIIQQRVVQSEIQPTEITEEEVRAVYEKQLESYRVPEMVELQQLFFEVGSGEKVDDVIRRARSLMTRVSEGSDLKAEAILAGVELVDVGQIPLEDLRPERRQALETLGEGELTAPLDAGDGVLVLRLVRRIPAGYRPLAEVKEEIRRRMSMESYEAQSRGLVDKLKKDYLVDIHRERLESVLAGLNDG